VRRWHKQATAAQGNGGVTTDWVRAKLCGRWPNGKVLRPGQLAPAKCDDFAIDFAGDDQGVGCPWAAHVRRMNSRGNPAGDAHQRERPLVRRGTPFGAAMWRDPNPDLERGLLGLFFCASLEDQFEHLLGHWANRRPLGAPDLSQAKDPLMGQHEDAEAALLLPQAAGAPLALKGFSPWTQTLGTLYAWHPSGLVLQRILDQDYLQPADEEPWF